jgi:hypothetical protein
MRPEPAVGEVCQGGDQADVVVHGGQLPASRPLPDPHRGEVAGNHGRLRPKPPPAAGAQSRRPRPTAGLRSGRRRDRRGAAALPGPQATGCVGACDRRFRPGRRPSMVARPPTTADLRSRKQAATIPASGGGPSPIVREPGNENPTASTEVSFGGGGSLHSAGRNTFVYVEAGCSGTTKRWAAGGGYRGS